LPLMPSAMNGMNKSDALSAWFGYICHQLSYVLQRMFE